MLRVADHVKLTDTGRQRRANEDAAFARSPLFGVADGMGGAQAGEIASGVAVAVLEQGLPDGDGSAEERLATLVREANAQIHDLSVADADRAGMGTTLTTAYLGEDELAIAHVGDSRLYVLRDDLLQRLTKDHSLVEELVEEGRLTPQEADEHPQRSIITRALGPENDVRVDSMSWHARDGDVYLLCSDGLTSMIPEARVAELVKAGAGAELQRTARSLIDAANEAGGRDNITVVLFRVEEVAFGAGAGVGEDTMVGERAPSADDVRALAGDTTVAARPLTAEPITEETVQRRVPRTPGPPPKPQRFRRLRSLGRLSKSLLILVVVLVPIAIGAYIATQSVYFVGADRQGFVTLYRGLPYDLPLNVHLYTTNYTSGVTVETLPKKLRSNVTDHELRSRGDGADLVSQLEEGTVAGQ